MRGPTWEDAKVALMLFAAALFSGCGGDSYTPRYSPIQVERAAYLAWQSAFNHFDLSREPELFEAGETDVWIGWEDAGTGEWRAIRIPVATAVPEYCAGVFSEREKAEFEWYLREWLAPKTARPMIYSRN